MDQEPQYSNQNPKRTIQLNKFAQPEIRVGQQKYMSMSSTLRKVKALERNKDFKRERMFLMPKQVRESIKTMQGASGVHLPRKDSRGEALLSRNVDLKIVEVQPSFG